MGKVNKYINIHYTPFTHIYVGTWSLVEQFFCVSTSRWSAIATDESLSWYISQLLYILVKKKCPLD